MKIRKYQPSDCRELTELFYNTVHIVNAKDYTEEQLNVWASGKVDLEKWNQSLQEHFSIVAVDNETIVGFGDIDDTGYLDRLFVHAKYQRKGIATAICEQHPLRQDLSLRREDIEFLKNNRWNGREFFLQILL